MSSRGQGHDSWMVSTKNGPLLIPSEKFIRQKSIFQKLRKIRPTGSQSSPRPRTSNVLLMEIFLWSFWPPYKDLSYHSCSTTPKTFLLHGDPIETWSALCSAADATSEAIRLATHWKLHASVGKLNAHTLCILAMSASE